MQLPCETSSRALNAMLSAIVHGRRFVWVNGSLFNISRMLCGKLPRDRAILIKPATAEQRTAEPVRSFSRVHRIQRNPSVKSSRSSRSCRDHCTDVAGSQRVLPGTLQVASFTRNQLMRAGIDLVNTPYNYLDLTPKGRDEAGRGQFWVRRHNEYED